MTNSNSEKETPDNDKPALNYLLVQKDNEIGTTSVVCTNCKKLVDMQWQMLKPMPIALTDSLEFIGLAKRLLFCPNCGNLSLKK